jgi:glycerol-3-phosphate cytidylyltransferase
LKNKKVGYTSGVYDMFHIGHLNVLKKAKELCDYLIVGVSTDELAQSYKGKQVIIPHKERIEIVNSIKYVDETVIQETLDKVEAWKKLHFDVLFVGSDWKGSEQWIAYERELSKVGVEVVYLPYTKGISSSRLRKLLLEKLLSEELTSENDRIIENQEK